MASSQGFDTKGYPSPTITHHSHDENLNMNKYHFIHVIEKLLQRPKFPQGEHVLIPLGFFLPLIFTLCTSEFKDTLGVPGFAWRSIAITFTVIFGVLTLVLLVWWIVNSIRYKPKTAEQIFDDVVSEMDKEVKRENTYDSKQNSTKVTK